MGCLDAGVVLLSLQHVPVVLVWPAVNIDGVGRLHCCPLEACVCMAVHGPSPDSDVEQQQRALPNPGSPSGPTEGTAATPPSGGKRSLTRTASLESITAERSFMKTTVCCQGTGNSLSDPVSITQLRPDRNRKCFVCI